MKIQSLVLLIVSMLTFNAIAEETQKTEETEEPTTELIEAEAPHTKINNIEYIGCQRVEKETVASYIPMQIGDNYDSFTINEVLKKLYATGFYEDVSITMNGNTLVIKVKEYPIVNKVSFEGNSKISDRDLNDKIKLKTREVLSPSKVREIQQGLLESYRKMGRYNASVNPKIIKLGNNRVNVVFEINEGDAAGIKEIRFVGNNHFSSGELRDVISSKIKRWYRFLVNDDIYDSDRMNEDKRLLCRHYQENGFASMEVISSIAELSTDKKGFILTFVIDEGDIYTFDAIKVISHIKKLDSKELSSDLYCKKGERYNFTLVEADLSNIIKNAGHKGFPAINVVPELKKDPKTRTVSMTYHIKEGRKVYISKIVIKGNTRTRDHIIRREIPLHEGDALNNSLLAMAENNIRDLGFFKSVKVDTISDNNSPDKCILQVEVEEQPTGELVVSGSYSTSDGLGLELGYHERNFFGTGKSLGVSLGSGRTRCGKSYYKDNNGNYHQISRKNKFRFLNSIVVSASDPHFLDKDIDGSISIYRYTSSRFDCFSTKEIGTTIGISYALTPKIQQGWDYTISNRKFDDIYAGASPIIKYQTFKKTKDGTTISNLPGKSNLSSLKHNISYGTAFLTGLKGSFRTGLSTTFAGIGGNAKHLKNELYGAYIVPVWKKATLKFGATYGLLTKIGKNPPLILDSFSLGLDSFRGFDDCGMGPMGETYRTTKYIDQNGKEEVKNNHPQKDYIGASKYWKGIVEFKFPIGLPEELQFRGFLFSDFGTAWGAPDKGKKLFTETTNSEGEKISVLNPNNGVESVGTSVGTMQTTSGSKIVAIQKSVTHKILDNKKIRVSVGFGVSFLTPFGPMVFTYAIPIRKEKFDEQQRFLVGFSTTF